MLLKTDPDKRYGIMLSGGLDSAVLFYLLIRSNPTINLQPFTIAKTDGAALYADPVIDHMNSKFGLSIPPTILVGDPTGFKVAQRFKKYLNDTQLTTCTLASTPIHPSWLITQAHHYVPSTAMIHVLYFLLLICTKIKYWK